MHERLSSCVSHLQRDFPLLHQPLQTLNMATLRGSGGKEQVTHFIIGISQNYKQLAIERIT